MSEGLYVEEGTGLVRKVNHWHGFVFSDEPYKPNGKHIFVNPKTNFLEEGKFISNPIEAFVHESHYKKTNDFKSNGNSVIFHPEKKELAEVRKGYGWGSYEKVQNLPIVAVA